MNWKSGQFNYSKTLLPAVALLAMLLGLITGCGDSGKDQQPRGSSTQGPGTPADNRAQQTVPNLFPVFNEKDINGKPLQRSDFIGKHIYVQFVDSNSIDDIDLLDKVFLNWIDEKLSIIVIPKDYEKFKSRVGIQLEEVTVFAHDYRKMQQIFNAPACCESFFIYDTTGRLVKSGYNTEGYGEGVKSELARLIKKETFEMASLISENENIENIRWLEQCRRSMIKNPHEYHIISMMTSICNTCLSGALVNKMVRLHMKKDPRLRIVTYVPEDYTDVDIKNLKKVLGIRYHVERAEGELQTEWHNQIQRYSEKHLTNIIMLVDKKGTILKVAHNDNSSLREFFDLAESMFESDKKSGGKKS
jgi:hypothetical protein